LHAQCLHIWINPHTGDIPNQEIITSLFDLARGPTKVATELLLMGALAEPWMDIHRWAYSIFSLDDYWT